jgi:hypothetical protein
MRVIKIINNLVVEVKTMLDSYQLQENEIVSDIGEVGQILQEDGTFITPAPAPVPGSESVLQNPTLDDKINYLYYKGLGVI